jgi:hypothetical protein
MNHIQRLTQERAEALAELDALRASIRELVEYYGSAKFYWPNNDFAHVTTDLYPRLIALLSQSYGRN